MAITIYLVMLNIYLVAIINQIPKMVVLARYVAAIAISMIAEIVISCLVCGLVHERSDQIYAILDQFNGNDLTDSEFKEWLMFKTSSRKTRFGFTIGGFASLRKTTLISVN